MSDPSRPPKLPSNNKFGWFFSAMLAIIALNSYAHQLIAFATAAAILSLVFMATNLLAPQLLAPLNQLWYSLGILLGKIISPVVLGAVFFAVITPAGLITRMFGRDELKIKKLHVKSYWLDRNPPGPTVDSFKNQF